METRNVVRSLYAFLFQWTYFFDLNISSSLFSFEHFWTISSTTILLLHLRRVRPFTFQNFSRANHQARFLWLLFLLKMCLFFVGHFVTWCFVAGRMFRTFFFPLLKTVIGNDFSRLPGSFCCCSLLVFLFVWKNETHSLLVYNMYMKYT